MDCPRIMISAPKSGSGKTLVTCALLGAFAKQEKNLCAFKCGPDYIDPMFHRQIFGIPSKNLDSYFAENEQLLSSFREGAKGSSLAVIEGAMGLYDGLGGILEKGSAYEIACITRTPIVLVVDARGMARSILPLLKGFLEYDREHLIKAVILNKTSGMFYETLKRQIEQELDIRVAGYFPVREDLTFESRHLGLVLPQEKKELGKQLEAAARQANISISLEILREIAGGAAARPIEVAGQETAPVCPIEVAGQETAPVRPSRFPRQKDAPARSIEVAEQEDNAARPLKIAVARDEAFCFYYEDNLRLLEKMGAELIFFSPLHDEKIPVDCQGFLLGGGYPELYLAQLSENELMRRSVRDAIEAGIPSLAECGGFMYLHETITDREGISYPMVGAVKADCTYRGKLVRFGYLELEGQKKDGLLASGETIRGHEFHYFDSTKNGADALAKKPVTQKTWSCCHIGAGHLWGFPHLYYPSAPALVERFLNEVRAYAKENKR